MTRSRSERLAVDGGRPVRERPFPPRRLFGPEERAAADALFDEAIETGQAFGYGGPREQAYEQAFAEMLGGGLAKLVNSGTSAVLAALAALELEPLSEVIVPPVSDPGGVMPVAMMNCVPVPADANGFSFNTGPEQIAAVLSERTRAVIVAHIMGEPADMVGVCALARRHHLAVIEDAAQAHGARLNGRPVGSFGDLAAFSTMSGKHHATGAQGGVVFTRDEQLFWKARRFMDRGKPFGPPESLPPGAEQDGRTGNVRMGLNLNSNELSAAIGSAQLRKLPGIVARRREVAAAVVERIADLETVTGPQLIEGAEATYWYLRLTVRPERITVDKERFAQAVQAEGVPVTVVYGHLPHEHLWFRRRLTYGRSGYPWPGPGGDEPPAALPNARAVVATNFLISAHENWTAEEIDDTAAALRKVERAYRRHP